MRTKTYFLVLNRLTNNARRAVNVVGCVRRRTMVLSEIEGVTRIFIQIHRLALPKGQALNLQKPDRFPTSVLYFRRKKQPVESLDIKTIEKELYSVSRPLNGEA